MKTSNNNKKLIFVKSMSLFILVIFLSTNIFAMNFPDIGKPAVNLKKITIQNYIVGLNSDNEGLRTSCIFFSAQYKIAEASDILKGQFEIPCRSVPLLGQNDFSDILVFLRRGVIHFIPVDECDHIGILLNGAAFP